MDDNGEEEIFVFLCQNQLVEHIDALFVQQFNGYEPLHDKTDKMACAPSEDSKAWVLSYLLSAQRRI